MSSIKAHMSNISTMKTYMEEAKGRITMKEKYLTPLAYT